jgi:hypothetical protein
MVGKARGGSAPTPPAPEQFSPLGLFADLLVVDALLLAGELPAALSRFESSPLAVAASASPFLFRLIGAERGAVLALLGRDSEAEPVLQQALVAAQSTKAEGSVAGITGLLAEIAIRRGDRAAARALLDSLAEDTGGVGWLFVLRARVLLGTCEAGALNEGCARLIAPGLALLSCTPA